MVEINNQRKAFLDMLAWSEGTDNGRQKNQKSWLWRHCRRRAFYWLLRSPSQTCHAKPKTQIDGWTLPASFPLVGCLPQKTLGFERLLSESGTLCACAAELRNVALYLWLIVVISVRQSTTLQQYLGFTAGRWLWSVFEHKADSLICRNSKKRAERSRDWWCERGHRSISTPGYLHHRLCLGLLIIAVINAIAYKAFWQKCQKN